MGTQLSPKIPSVLLLVFNRPDSTRAVMKRLAEVKPSRLYVAADGPRQADEMELCEFARDIATTTDWSCETKTLFRATNLGIRAAVSSAIDWFFENEVEGIILEDDCLPSDSFFLYCSELLGRYRYDTRIMAVSGSNFQRGRLVSRDSYYFSKYPHCWGWATWRRAWSLYDSKLEGLATFEALGGFSVWSDGSDMFEKKFRNVFLSLKEKKLDSWAYCWMFSCWSQNGLTCIPSVNLVANIGFASTGTHCKQSDSWLASLERRELAFPLKHPERVVRAINADRDTAIMVFGVNDKKFVRRPKLQQHLNVLRILKKRLMNLIFS